MCISIYVHMRTHESGTYHHLGHEALRISWDPPSSQVAEKAQDKKRYPLSTSHSYGKRLINVIHLIQKIHRMET